MKKSLAQKVSLDFNEAYFKTFNDYEVYASYVEYDIDNVEDYEIVIRSYLTTISHHVLKLAMQLCTRYGLLMCVKSDTSLRIIIHS